MDKIFREIKQAIEEEMARQEGRPTTGGGPPQGRDTSRYDAWLREEQERLRGSGSASDRDDGRIVDPETAVREEPVRQREETRRQRRQRQRETASQDTAAAQAAEAAQIARREALQRTDRHQRTEARHERRSRTSYDQGGGQNWLLANLSRSLQTRRGLRQAMLLSEIVGKPVSLRKPDDHLIN